MTPLMGFFLRCLAGVLLVLLLLSLSEYVLAHGLEPPCGPDRPQGVEPPAAAQRACMGARLQAARPRSAGPAAPHPRP